MTAASSAASWGLLLAALCRILRRWPEPADNREYVFSVCSFDDAEGHRSASFSLSRATLSNRTYRPLPKTGMW
jgi:hypothetical protein